MNKEEVNIICLLWKGNFRGRNYKDSDVELLRETVTKHIDRPFRFYCLTNDMNANISAEKIKLLHNWPGWWSKVELFRPDLPYGRTLYLDLDVVVVDSLQPILDTTGNLVMFPSPYSGNSKVTKDGKRNYKYHAGIMLFDPASLSWIYNKFRENPIYWMINYRSEQDLYAEWIPDQPTFDSKWLMKLGFLKKEKKLKNETIIISGNKNGEFRNLEFAPWLNKIARE